MRCLPILLLALITNIQQSYSKIRHARGRAKRQEAGGWEPSSWVWGDEGGGHGGGDWGPWSPPSNCSRPCGGGVAMQTRICRSSDCWGSTTRYFTCNLNQCPDDKDFRAIQCAEYNKVLYEGIYYDWIPYTKAPNKCALNCMPRGERFYYRHNDKVIDGTLCSDESLDVCVNGECKHVGCDKMLGSQLEEDKCRICGGDGSACETKKDTLYSNEFKVGYNDLFMVPAGATNIRVKEVEPSNNYLAIRNSSNHYYLNGNWRIDYPRILKFAGTVFHYGRKPHGFFAPESIIALGPTTEVLFVVLLYQERNPGVEYEYSLPEGSVIQTDPEGYTWFTEGFSECSTSCGGGFQSRRVWCAKVKDSSEASTELCDAAHEPPSTQICSTNPCPPEWSIPEWSACSVTCGNGTQNRMVHCQQVVSGAGAILLNDSVCLESVGEKPEITQPCGDPLPCPIWHIGPWKPCDKLCGNGVQRRLIQCYRKIDDKINLLPDSYCPQGDKPDTEKHCTLRPCEGVDWVTGEWSGCSDKCGLAFETREAVCANADGKIFNDSLCHEYRKPELKRVCNTSESCPSQWYTSQWSPCSSKCGPGVQSRHVFCGSFFEAEGTVKRVNENECDASKKFEDQQACVGEGSCKGEWFMGAWGQCSKPCGGGQRSRKVLCFKNNQTVNMAECDSDSFDFFTSTCNSHPCGEDEILPVESDSAIMEESSEECEEGEEEEDVEDVGSSEGGEEEEPSEDTKRLKIAITKKPLTTVKTTEKDSQAESFEDIHDFIDVRMGGITPQKIEEYEGSGDMSTVFTESGSIMSSTDSATEATDTVSGTESLSESSSLESSTDAVSEEVSSQASVSSVGTTDVTESSVGSTDLDLTSIMMSDGTSVGVSDLLSSEKTSKDGETTVSVESSSKDTTSSTEENVSTSTESQSSENQSSITETSSETSTGATSTESSSEASSTDASTSSDSTTESSSDSTLSSESTTISSDSTAMSSDGTSSGTTEKVLTDGTSTSSDSSTLFSSSSNEITSPSGTSPVSDASSISETSVTTSVSESAESTSESSWASTMLSSIVSLIKESSSERPVSSSSESVSTELVSTDLTSGISDATESGTDTSVSSSDVTPDSDLKRLGEGVTELSASTDSTRMTESDMDEDKDTTSWSQTVFGVTSAESAVTREQTTKKCKKRPKIKKCVKSEFGCCPDGRIPAKGPFGKDCPKVETCKDTKYGCCQDGVSPAKGGNFLGCPPSQCEETLFGCCPNGYDEAMGNEYEGCPVTTTLAMDCTSTEFGCCPDGILSAAGPNSEGCYDCDGSAGPCEECLNTKFGCCPDNVTVASGPDNDGCDLTITTTEFLLFTMGDSEECENSTFGCCPDGIRLATGPDDEGCEETTDAPPLLCQESEFGCCPDGNTTASGPNLEGCETSCATEPYGCCDGSVTPAHGPNKEGCCISSPYGCCKDNIQPAEGPNYEGCSCDNSPYGCCPDGRTAASGPSNEGCGCEYTQHGCCPDKTSTATGPDYEGCPCYTYQFGCCPDGIKHAVGPRMLGCGCENSPHGCCPDGKTPKPDEGNCTCDASPYGCCLDGIESAVGEKFEGCKTKPRRPGDICGLPKDRGPCREFSVKWHYDTEYGGCSRFWFGSCEGNGNKFNSQEECKQFCIEPKGRDACYLPKIEGPCQGYYPRWHYDPVRKDCTQFIYGGCLGNNNKFETVEQCRELCVIPDNLDACDQELDAGPCEGQFDRWYFDKEARACHPFHYGGCEGNKNNFLTETACSAKCLSPQRQRKMGKCELEPDAGPCKDEHKRWYYNITSGQCSEFTYGGCLGNLNRFDSKVDCQLECKQPEFDNSVEEVSVCGQPPLEGDCHNFTIRYYFDTLEARCKQFYYGGCGGNTNNFQTEVDCYKRCEPSKLPPEPEEPPFTRDMCMLPYEVGSCTDSISSWFFDSRDGICKEFEYSGCHGNGNRFPSLEECEASCEGVVDICRLGTVQVRCDASSSPTWYYYDPASEACRQYADTLCPGNGNRFQSREECQARCRPGGVRPPVTQAPYLPDICWARLDPGPCLKQLSAWWYDQSSGRCQPFSYGGCEGNANRFSSEEQCERQCGQFRRHDTCWENKDVGSCDQVQSKFFFNVVSKQCEEFLYSGCGGNTNRYSSAEECQAICISKQEPPIVKGENSQLADQEICRLPVEPGSCSGYIERYHFDESTKACSPFVFTGCSANLNNFHSYDECMAFCAPELSHRPNEVDQDDCYEEESECTALTDCSYGVEMKPNSRGCNICSCHLPCEGFDCGTDSLCSVSTQSNPVTLNTEYIPVCHPISKAGRCPEVSMEATCDELCSKDTQCPGVEKCCYNGCGTQCLRPEFDEDITTARPHPHQGVEPPQILTDDSDTNVISEEGNFASLKCVVRGSPIPQITWKKDGVFINSTGTSKYRLLSDGTLQVIGLIKDDSGLYICIAENGIGRPITKEFHLKVNVPVKVRINVDKTEYAPGQDISLPCDVEGFPMPQVTWYKNGEEIYSSNRISITDSHRLMISGSEITDAGRYRCHADNTYTSSEAVVDIQVKGIFVPHNCTDNPFFANCKLIVQANYCPHEYYAKFCCKSCTEAGQIQHPRFKRSLNSNSLHPEKLHMLPLTKRHIQLLPIPRQREIKMLPLPP